MSLLAVTGRFQISDGNQGPCGVSAHSTAQYVCELLQSTVKSPFVESPWICVGSPAGLAREPSKTKHYTNMAFILHPWFMRTSWVRGPDTLWRVPWTRLFGFTFRLFGCSISHSIPHPCCLRTFVISVVPPRSFIDPNVTGQRTRHLVAGTLDPIVGFPFY